MPFVCAMPKMDPTFEQAFHRYDRHVKILLCVYLPLPSSPNGTCLVIQAGTPIRVRERVIWFMDLPQRA
jgi:hypothetical protein